MQNGVEDIDDSGEKNKIEDEDKDDEIVKRSGGDKFFGIEFSSTHDFSFMFFIDSKQVPRNGNLSFGNRKQSPGAKLGKYGDYSME